MCTFCKRKPPDAPLCIAKQVGCSGDGIWVCGRPRRERQGLRQLRRQRLTADALGISVLRLRLRDETDI